MKYLALLLSLCIFGGAPRECLQPQQPLCRVVTQIQVVAAQDADIHTYVYTDTEKIEILLTYLRLLNPRAAQTIAADTFRADAFQITLQYSDGNRSDYYQIYNDYLRKDNGCWQKIEADQAATLLPLLSSMPSDQ